MTAQLDQISEAIGGLRAEVRNMAREIGDLKRDVELLTAMKNRGWGIVVTVSLFSAFVGGKIAPLLGGMGGIVK